MGSGRFSAARREDPNQMSVPMRLWAFILTSFIAGDKHDTGPTSCWWPGKQYIFLPHRKASMLYSQRCPYIHVLFCHLVIPSGLLHGTTILIGRQKMVSLTLSMVLLADRSSSCCLSVAVEVYHFDHVASWETRDLICTGMGQVFPFCGSHGSILLCSGNSKFQHREYYSRPLITGF